MRIEIFVQARMGSTRLPGKVLKKVSERPLLDYLMERLGQAREVYGVVILTSTQKADDVIECFCREKKIACYRGSEDDVLDRYYQAAFQRKPDGIVRVTADCPLVDPEVLDDVVREFKDNYPTFDYVSNSLKRTFPRGLDVEVFSFQALEKAWREAKLPEEREHVTLYLYQHPELFSLKNVKHVPSLAQHRWTVDTLEDFALVSLILEHLYPSNPHFRLDDVVKLLKQHPAWVKLNAHIEQKSIS